MLVTLLVIWVVVVPALTVAGTYVLSGIFSRRLNSHDDRPVDHAPATVHTMPTRVHPRPTAKRRGPRSRDLVRR